MGKGMRYTAVRVVLRLGWTGFATGGGIETSGVPVSLRTAPPHGQVTGSSTERRADMSARRSAHTRAMASATARSSLGLEADHVEAFLRGSSREGPVEDDEVALHGRVEAERCCGQL
jgi:hypothetical protein